MGTATRTSLCRGGAVGAAAALVSTFVVVASGTAGATATATSSRIAGSDRFATAAQIAATAFPSGASTVILASGENANFPDALAGNYLAGEDHAPILLTTNSGSTVPAVTSTELSALGAHTIIVLGSSSSVPDAQISSLQTAGYAVTRLGGATRYDTAKAVAESPSALSVGTIGGVRTAIVADGQNFPDAVSAGALAYADRLPVVLTTPSALSTQAKQTLTDLGVGQVIIVGATPSISSAVESTIQGLGISTLYRAAGTDRANTSQLLADWEIANGGFASTSFVLASGAQALGGADALAGGPLAGSTFAPILLTDTVTAPGAATTFASAHQATLASFTVLGSTSSVSAVTEAAVLATVQGNTGTTPPTGNVAAGTARPELRYASIVSTTASGTTVSYTFDETVGSAVANDFKVYDAFDTPTLGGSITSVNAGVVQVLYPGITTTTQAATLTTATVVEGAVQDLTGLTNPEGDAGIGSTTSNGTSTLPAGITTAPDLTSVSAPRAAATAGQTAMTFYFDQAAYPDSAAVSQYTLYELDGTTVPGTGPTAAQTAASNTSPGGAGSTALTVVFPTTTTLTSAQVARVTIGANTVYADAALTAGKGNVLQAAELSNNGATVNPDLLSVQLIPATDSSSDDQVLYTFDQTISTVDPTKFYVYYQDASKAPLQALSVATTGTTKVLMNFAHASLAGVVGGYTLASAVAGSQIDERGATGSLSTAGQTSDRTTGPDLVSVTLTGATDVLGNVNYSVTYTFDQAIDTATITAAKFHLWLADGTKLDAGGTPTVDSVTDTKVTFQYTDFTHDVGGAAATSAEVGSSGNATVEAGAVTDSTNTHGNPEGSS